MNEADDTDSTTGPATGERQPGPTWRPAYPGDTPPQRLIEAKLDYDRQKMGRALDSLGVSDPAVRREMIEAMLAKRSYDAKRIEDACRTDEPPTNALECGLQQGWSALDRASNRFTDRYDIHKPFRDMLLAVAAYHAGNLAPLRKLRGEAPNVTKGADPVGAMTRAVITICVQRLMAGKEAGKRFNITAAARHVADWAKDSGLPRTWKTVRNDYYVTTNGGDQAAADWHTLIAPRCLHAGDAELSQRDRLARLRRMRFFAEVA